MDGYARAVKPITAEAREKTFLEIGGKQLKMLKDTIDELPLLRATEVQEAQAKIVELVRQLEETGTRRVLGIRFCEGKSIESERVAPLGK